jgi:hypothetical protein
LVTETVASSPIRSRPRNTTPKFWARNRGRLRATKATAKTIVLRS